MPGSTGTSSNSPVSTFISAMTMLVLVLVLENAAVVSNRVVTNVLMVLLAAEGYCVVVA